MKISVFIISLTLAVALIAAGALTTSAADYYIMPGCNPPGYTSSYPCPNCDDNMVYDRFDDSEYVPLYECYPTYRRMYHNYECYPPSYEEYPPYECYPQGYILKNH